MEIKGKAIQNLGLQTGKSKAGKDWVKCELIIETTENPQYPKKVKITNLKKAEEFSKIPLGVDVVFNIEIDSNEYNGKWYTNVSCWKWEIAQQPQQPYAQPQQPYQQPPQGYQQQPYAPQGAQPFYGQPPTYPVNPNSTRPTLDSMGVHGYQQPQTQPLSPASNATQDSDDLLF